MDHNAVITENLFKNENKTATTNYNVLCLCNYLCNVVFPQINLNAILPLDVNEDNKIQCHVEAILLFNDRM